jgi:hypothetical protein
VNREDLTSWTADCGQQKAKWNHRALTETAGPAETRNTMRGQLMQRFGMTLRLKPGAAEAYKAHHRTVWPEVLKMITECNIRNYSIYFKDDVLFSYFEYHGSDMKKDSATGVVGCDAAPSGAAGKPKGR